MILSLVGNVAPPSFVRVGASPLRTTLQTITETSALLAYSILVLTAGPLASMFLPSITCKNIVDSDKLPWCTATERPGYPFPFRCLFLSAVHLRSSQHHGLRSHRCGYTTLSRPKHYPGVWPWSPFGLHLTLPHLAPGAGEGSRPFFLCVKDLCQVSPYTPTLCD